MTMCCGIENRKQTFVALFTGLTGIVNGSTRCDPTIELMKEFLRSQIDGVLFQTIVEQTNGDIVAAAWITGKDHRLASVRRFYRASARQKLQSIYLRAATSIAEELARNGYALTVRGDAINPGNGIFVGSWNCPKLEVVREAVHRLKNDLRDSMQISGESPTEEEFVRRHNLYTLYSVWSFGFAVGARGVHTPYLHLSQVDRFTGMARMHDKGPENGYRTRVLWLPPKAQQQIAYYNDYLSALHVSHSLPSATRANPCYFLASTTKVLAVQPRSLAPWMAKYLPFPAQTHGRETCISDVRETTRWKNNSNRC